MNEIVVGVDLSQAARDALRWAAEQARATGQQLRAVHVIDLSPTVNMALGMGAVAESTDTSAIDNTYRPAVSELFESVQPEPGWHLEFCYGNAGQILVAESGRAALLVVGTREHVGIARLISGSVSHHCLSHARCPVVAVPASPAEGPAEHDQATDALRAHPGA